MINNDSSEKIDELSDILQVEGVKAKGYGIIPKIVMQDPRLTISAKAIYAYMCSFAGSGTTAFPCVEKICKDLGIKDYNTFKKTPQFA
ncbi:helix-turn-helix domain-containing protein [Thermoanaerobacterium sp. DL9XJH110]|uniref:helix-turn-helix domain-containing protein n=1 Tax=Thermoanaerobacterium sp. DL9XJH110 TaxID=3386643 RepID=UPI003BB71E5F